MLWVFFGNFIFALSGRKFNGNLLNGADDSSESHPVSAWNDSRHLYSILVFSAFWCLLAAPNRISDQKKAVTRLLLHAKHAATTHPRILIHLPYIDVNVAHFEGLCCQDRDTVYKLVHAIQPSPDSVQVFTVFTALTGSLSWIGKKKAWKVLLRKEQMQRTCAAAQFPNVNETVPSAQITLHTRRLLGVWRIKDRGTQREMFSKTLEISFLTFLYCFRAFWRHICVT